VGVKDLQDLKKIAMLRSQIESKTVEDIMDTEYPSIGPDEKLNNALMLMKGSGYQDIPVIDDGEYIGMISYGSVLKKKSIALDSKVRNLISSSPVITKDMGLTKVAEMMILNNLRQIPVVNTNRKKVIGCIGRKQMIDLVIGIKVFKDIQVFEIMNTPVESVRDNQLLDDALEIMRELDIRTVPVTDSKGAVTGIVGMKEVLENNWKSTSKTVGDISGKTKKTSTTIESICMSAVKTVEWNDDIETAVELMSDNSISTIPVLDEGKMVGILTQYDIIELISACRERQYLFIQLSGLDDEDKAYSGAIYDSIRDEVQKINKIVSPESLSVNVAKYNEKGDKNKYSITARLIADGRAYSAKQVDWDLIKTVDDLMGKITAMVIDEKDSVTSRRRKK
jgi:CBS domain-containing protein